MFYEDPDKNYCEEKGFYILEQISNVVSIIGTVIGICLNLTPIVLFYEYLKKRRTIQEIPQIFFFTGLLTNTLNLSSGATSNSLILVLSSAICLGLTYVWTFWYLFISTKGFLKNLLHMFILINLAAEIFIIFYTIIKREYSSGILAVICTIMTVINNAAPGQNIIKVIKEGNYKLIPIVTTGFGTICSILYLIFGIIGCFENRTRKSIRMNLILSNGISSAINIFQCTVWLITYIKNRGKFDLPQVTPGPDDGDATGDRDEENSLTRDQN